MAGCSVVEINLDTDSITAWRNMCFDVADRILDGGCPAPITTSRVDQILAAAREAGLTEREQGVLLFMFVEGAINRRSWAKSLPTSKRMAISTAIAMRLLQGL